MSFDDGKVRVSNSLVIEVLADGGIRLTPPDGETELASLPATLDWIAEANREAWPCICAASSPRHWPSRSLSRGAPSRLLTRRGAVGARAVAEATIVDADRGRQRPDRTGRRPIRPGQLARRRERAADTVPAGDAARTHRRVGRLARCRRGTSPRPRAAGGAARCGRAPRLHTAWMWWLLVPCGALAVAAMFDGAYAAVPVFLITPLLGIAMIHLLLGNTRCAVHGPYVARLRGRRWQGPVDLRTLDALGHTPRGTPSMPLIWVLGQREAGERPNVYSKSAFDKKQLTAIKSARLRFVPLYAAGGFMSPGFERLVARHLDPTNVIVGRAGRRPDLAGPDDRCP